jgi:hypothetical protein
MRCLRLCPSTTVIEARVRERLAEWRGLFGRQVALDPADLSEAASRKENDAHTCRSSKPESECMNSLQNSRSKGCFRDIGFHRWYVPRGTRRVVHAHRPMVRRTTGRIIFSSGIALLPSSGGPHEHAVDPTEDIELLVEHATPPVLHSVELRPPHATAMNSGCRTRHASCPISCIGAGLQPCPLVL